MPEVQSSAYDVAIVGAGPAGATAAIHLARRGHRVLLLDRHGFPRDKVCGDALIPDAVRALARCGLEAEVRARGHELSVASVFSPSQIAFDVPGTFVTLKRFVLDDLIVRHAQSQGAEFRRASVTGITVERDGTVGLTLAGELGPVSLRARYALLATGADVRLAETLDLVERAQPSALALRCYVTSPSKLDRLIISYDRSIMPGYAWIFPLGRGEFNVGCGIIHGAPGDRTNLREIFWRFAEHFPLARDLMRQATQVTPLRGAMLRCGLHGTRPKAAGNVLAIGESIGATFPFTGEGIGKAMETGELAAETCHEALSGVSGALERFEGRLEQELRPKFLGYQIAQNWFSRGWLTDLIARRARRSQFMREGIAGIVDETVDPRVVFSVGGLLRSLAR